MQIIRLIKDLSVKSTRSPGNALCQEHEQFASEHDRNVPTFPLCPLLKEGRNIKLLLAMLRKPLALIEFSGSATRVAFASRDSLLSDPKVRFSASITAVSEYIPVSQYPEIRFLSNLIYVYVYKTLPYDNLIVIFFF